MGQRRHQVLIYISTSPQIMGLYSKGLISQTLNKYYFLQFVTMKCYQFKNYLSGMVKDS